MRGSSARRCARPIRTAGSSSPAPRTGLISTDTTASLHLPAPNGTIFDRLDAHKIDFGIYYQQVPSWLIIPGILSPPGRRARQHKFDQFLTDAAAGHAAGVLVHRPELRHHLGGEPAGHPGRRAVRRPGRERRDASRPRGSTRRCSSPTTSTAATTTTCRRRARSSRTTPSRLLKPGDVRGGYDRYGFRVPLFVVSPWAKKGYVSRVTQDHTSITAFIERKWNLPAMTFRDANAEPMTDYFDFRKPAFSHAAAARGRARARPRARQVPCRGPQPAAAEQRIGRLGPHATSRAGCCIRRACQGGELEGRTASGRRGRSMPLRRRRLGGVMPLRAPLARTTAASHLRQPFHSAGAPKRRTRTTRPCRRRGQAAAAAAGHPDPVRARDLGPAGSEPPAEAVPRRRTRPLRWSRRGVPRTAPSRSSPA